MKPNEPQWIVNSLGEFGVRIGDRFYFHYKYDDPLIYTTEHEQEVATGEVRRLQWRPVFKREFGECIHPDKFQRQGHSESPYLDGEGWQPLPLVAATEPPSAPTPEIQP